jgi:hypothetical protein
MSQSTLEELEIVVERPLAPLLLAQYLMVSLGLMSMMMGLFFGLPLIMVIGLVLLAIQRFFVFSPLWVLVLRRESNTLALYRLNPIWVLHPKEKTPVYAVRRLSYLRGGDLLPTRTKQGRSVLSLSLRFENEEALVLSQSQSEEVMTTLGKRILEFANLPAGLLRKQ